LPAGEAAMFMTHWCIRCGKTSKRSECEVDPDGLFGRELLCPRCGALVRPRPTALGWALMLAAGAVAGVAVYRLQ
jgi:NAD-dependent SIR2 family protein deacetylase